MFTSAHLEGTKVKVLQFTSDGAEAYRSAIITNQFQYPEELDSKGRIMPARTQIELITIDGAFGSDERKIILNLNDALDTCVFPDVFLSRTIKDRVKSN